MQFNELRSIAHNVADSLASGYSPLVGMSELNVFGETSSSPERFIEVDFLTGATTGSPISLKLRHRSVPRGAAGVLPKA